MSRKAKKTHPDTIPCFFDGQPSRDFWSAEDLGKIGQRIDYAIIGTGRPAQPTTWRILFMGPLDDDLEHMPTRWDAPGHGPAARGACQQLVAWLKEGVV